MSVVIHNVPGTKPFQFNLTRRLRRQKGSRNLLFDEQFANRKKVWNRWVGDQHSLAHNALANMATPYRKTLHRRNNRPKNNNNNINTSNLQTANLNAPEWKLAVGNTPENVPNVLKYRRTHRSKAPSL